jgi:hypothetical protein
LNAGLATASIFTIMEAGILLQSKEPPLFSVPVILFFHAAKLTVDQVRSKASAHEILRWYKGIHLIISISEKS